MSGLSGVLAAVAGRRAKWVVIGAWLVAAAILVPFSGRFEAAQDNDAAAFLPADSQSTRAVELAERFAEEEELAAIVVFRREAGLTAEDRARLEEAQRAILGGGIAGVVPAPVPPQSSEDGRAVLLFVPIAVGGDQELVTDAVGEIREAVAGAEGDGLEVAVTGPAGFAADVSEVFAGIDGLLLGATAAIVAVLLLLTYRSPTLWLVPLGVVAFAEIATRGLGYWLARAGLSISGYTGGLLVVLVFGAGTDYALLLTSRYREELRRHEDKHVAMREALRRAGPTIVASAGTVAAALLCLMVAELGSNRGLGPVAAVGIGMALLAMVTLLPATLLIVGRRVFWPFVPRVGSAGAEESRLFSAVGRAVARRPRPVWIATALLLALLAAGLGRTSFDLFSDDLFRGSVESVEGAALLAESFPAGTTAATTVYVEPAGAVAGAAQRAIGVEGVAQVLPAEEAPTGDVARFGVVFADDPYSDGAFATVERLRDGLGAGATVGGPSAEEADTRTAALRDATVIVPLILAVVLAILVLLLRSVAAPVLLMGTVVLSYTAALGASVLVFEWGFGFPGIDPNLPLLGFVFLVALGVDYNIFLMDRAREEAQKIGTRPGMLRALSVTGGVITSAGLVLAGTFAVLGVLPLVVLTQVGFVVAFGVLLDTVVVRSVLVPALALDFGPRIWWPSALSRRREGRTAMEGAVPEAVSAD